MTPEKSRSCSLVSQQPPTVAPEDEKIEQVEAPSLLRQGLYEAVSGVIGTIAAALCIYVRSLLSPILALFFCFLTLYVREDKKIKNKTKQN